MVQYWLTGLLQVLVKVVTKDGVREVDFDNDKIVKSA